MRRGAGVADGVTNMSIRGSFSYIKNIGIQSNLSLEKSKYPGRSYKRTLQNMGKRKMTRDEIGNIMLIYALNSLQLDSK